MDSVFSFVVGLLTAAMSLLGFVQQHPELPQSSRDQAQQIAQQAIMQATNALNTAPTQTTQTQNITSTPLTTTTQTGTKTYTNSQYGFSFQYPSNLSVISPGKVYGEYSFHAFATQSVAGVVSGPKSFSVYVSSNPNDISNCLSVRADYSLPGYEGGNLAKMTTINGVQFAVFNGFENAAMGRSENGTVYNALKNNACYSIDVRSITNRDDTQTYINSGAVIDSIINSFSFGTASVSQSSGTQTSNTGQALESQQSTQTTQSGNIPPANPHISFTIGTNVSLAAGQTAVQSYDADTVQYDSVSVDKIENGVVHVTYVENSYNCGLSCGPTPITHVVYKLALTQGQSYTISPGDRYVQLISLNGSSATLFVDTIYHGGQKVH